MLFLNFSQLHLDMILWFVMGWSLMLVLMFAMIGE